MPEKVVFTPRIIDTHCIIDVRTPLEFADDHIPGACNVPLLTNEERVEVGTLYKQVGPTAARRRALALTCPRFSELVEQISAYAAGRPIIVYCWRGGLRSKSVVMLLELCGIPAKQLVGGYKAYRAEVIRFFETCSVPMPIIVMHGMTGTGKTTFINGLPKEKWGIIDLEGLACHRGSAFGALGMEQSITQKHFETNLWDAFRRLPEDLPIIVEGESPRIGRYSLPGVLYQTMAASCKVWCYAALETRIERLTDEYARPEFQEKMLEALERIKKKLGGVRTAELKQMIVEWDVRGIARGLIEWYYDKMYYSQRTWTEDLRLDLEDFTRAERELSDFWRTRIALQPASGTDSAA